MYRGLLKEKLVLAANNWIVNNIKQLYTTKNIKLFYVQNSFVWVAMYVRGP